MVYVLRIKYQFCCFCLMRYGPKATTGSFDFHSLLLIQCNLLQGALHSLLNVKAATQKAPPSFAHVLPCAHHTSTCGRTLPFSVAGNFITYAEMYLSKLHHER